MFKIGELKLGTQIRIALLIFLLALVTANLLSTVSMLESRLELERQERHNFAAQSLSLATTVLRHNDDSFTRSLIEDLALAQTDAAVGVYDENGVRISSATLNGDNLALQLLPQTAWRESNAMPSASSIEATIRTLQHGDKNYYATEVPLIRRAQQSSTSASFYLILVGVKSPRFTTRNYFVFAFQCASILLCGLFVHFFSRWLIYPYRQVASIAKASSLVLKNASTQTSQQSLIDTFQTAINELKFKEQQLQKMNQRERERAQGYERLSARIVTSIPSGLVAVDSGGKLIVANEQAYRILEALPEPNSESGQTYQKLFESCPSLIELLAQCLTSGRTYRRQEVIAEIPNKGRRTLEVSVSPIGKGYQDIHGALCLIADITEINAMREQMQVRENLASLGEMAAGIAHEFKNSLATIQGFAQLIENTGTLTEISGALIDETRHLTQMVSDFLRFARPEQFQAMDVDLDELIGDCVEELNGLAKENDVTISITGQIPGVTGDEMMLRHSFLNLIRNAIESMSGLPVRELKISGEISNSGFGQPAAVVHVSDTGCGIPAELLTKIFIPFFSTKSRGYGIGLAIVQKVFSGHGGRVEVTSVEGTGTTFHCRLPLATEQNMSPQAALTERPALTSELPT